MNIHSELFPYAAAAPPHSLLKFKSVVCLRNILVMKRNINIMYNVIVYEIQIFRRGWRVVIVKHRYIDNIIVPSRVSQDVAVLYYKEVLRRT